MASLSDITDIVDRVWFWINKSDATVPAKIAAAYNQKGGWEGWAQVEIAYLVHVKYPNVTIDREVNVYAGTKKENDFVITDNVQPTKPKQIVELKCERGTQTAAQFKQSFIDDIQKINSLPIAPAYKPAKAYALGISCTAACHKLMMETEWKNLGYKVTWTQGPAGSNIWMWWYEKDVV
ncbi:MAG: hypothetical protein Q9182_007423 [Xanthomendoza sp. 2 TL-2023]